MQSFSFEALGTRWKIIFDEKSIPHYLTSAVKQQALAFEKKYSRFIPDSLVSKYAQKQHITDTEFAALLDFGKQLEKHTKGAFSLNAGKHLATLGYGSEKQTIDFGAFGKGWLTDTIAKYFQASGCTSFVINAGGDIYATTKSDGSPWTVALEHPQNPQLTIGTTTLTNQALAGSSPFKRVWNNHTHLVSGRTGKPITHAVAIFTTAPSAATADALATCGTILRTQAFARLAHAYQVDFLRIHNEVITHKSSGFAFYSA